MVRVAVFGAAGRMGSEVCRAVSDAPDLELVGAVDPTAAGVELAKVAGVTEDLTICAHPSEMPTRPDVAVDFTIAEAALVNVDWCIANNVHSVVGTSGLTAQQIEVIRTSIDATGRETGVLIAANFAIGAVLLMEFSRMAAQLMPEAEIIELHHPGKKDAPSGTAIKTAEAIREGHAIADVSPAASPGAESEIIKGARGAERDTVHIHSVRLPGLVAHQEVIFGGQGQILSIRHDSIDRTSFMPGVLLAVRQIPKHPGLTVGLEHFIELW
ncbi:MAG: 4-hydroxy-tetrahydrodipicolinate reductase [Actinomycetota bacterium]|nr:4-hydroxy-tetrahydrodipicolinate reductase [Actinomycetota bacterium]